MEVFSLAGKRALVTGGTGYLGRAMVFGLASSGAHVIINGRDREKLEELNSELLTRGFSSELAHFDLLDNDKIDEFVRINLKNPLDILVNNAYGGDQGTIQSSVSQQYIDSYQIGMVAVSELTKKLLPMIRQAKVINGDASVINIASMYGMVSPDLRVYASNEVSNPPFYGAVKAALIQWTKYASVEFGVEGIRFNSISPGPFPEDSKYSSGNELFSKLANKVPLGRVGLQEEIIGPVVFLASSASSFVNGANLVVDGGWTAK